MSDTTDVILNRLDSFEKSMFHRLDAMTLRVNAQDLRIDSLEHGAVRNEVRSETNKTLRKRLFEFGLVLLSGAISAFAAYSAATYNPPTPPLETMLPPKASTSISTPIAVKDPEGDDE